jgi:hypothetical protein
MRFSAILIALTASVFAEKNLVKCLERANYDVGLSYDCFEKAIKKGRKSKESLYRKNRNEKDFPPSAFSSYRRLKF